MIDIHPPQHGAMTRREFFTHLGIVILGILIAIGLEQTVEAIHQHQQVREARTMLRRELQDNRRNLAEDISAVDTHLAQLWSDLAVVARARAHKPLPGDEVVYIFPSESLQSVAWQTVQASNISEHMDPHEFADYGNLYRMQQAIDDMMAAANTQLQMSLSPLVASEDPRIDTTAQDEQIESHTNSPQAMAAAIHLLNHDNHPERLSAAQLDAVQRGLLIGITEDRRLQRYLGALGRDYERFERSHPAP